MKNDYNSLKELKKFLKEHLKIELYIHCESYRSYLEVKIKIDEEEIDSSICYDIELWKIK